MAGHASAICATLSDGVLLFSLQDPSGIPRLSRALLHALDEQFQDAGRRPEISAVVLTGTEECFAAGAHLAEVNALTPNEALRFAALGQALMQRIESLPKPVVAAV